MRVTNVKYERLNPDGQYGNQHIGVEIELGEGDDYQQALSAAKLVVHSALGIAGDDSGNDWKRTNRHMEELIKDRELLALLTGK